MLIPNVTLTGKTVLVTGVAGFIGSNLAQRLLQEIVDVRVVGIDNMNDYYDVRLKEERLKKLSGHELFTFIKGDISDKQTIYNLFQEYKPQVVVNLAAQAGVRYSITNPDVLLNIHIAQTDCTLSLDSSGESLHRRGYRQEAVEAPLNEVLAAGMILMTGWHGECDLIDPMCGSGTIPIEAALIARNVAPGVFRQGYAFENWPDFDADLLETVYNDDSRERPFEHKIYGYDNSPKAQAIAQRNVKAAGMSRDIVLKLQPFQQFEQPREKSLIITNPPYGERISSDDLLGLYRMIGERLKHAFAGNTAWVLSYRDECFDQIGLKPSQRVPLLNGGLECEFRKYEIFDGKYKEFREGGETLDKPQTDDRRPAAPRRPARAGEDRPSRQAGGERRRTEHANRGARREEKPAHRPDRGTERRPRSGESYPERKRREMQAKKENRDNL